MTLLRRRHVLAPLATRLPAGLVAAPFEVLVAVVALVRGLSNILGVTPANAAEQSLPPWLRVACLAYLAVGASMLALGVVVERLGPPCERMGAKLTIPAAVSYGTVLWYATGFQHALVYIVLYYGLACACLVRLATIREGRQTIRTTREQAR